MKNLAYLLLAAGFLGGAFVTSLDVTEVDWLWFAIASIAAIAGVVLAKRSDRAAAMDQTLLDNNRTELNDALQGLLSNLKQETSGEIRTGQALLDWIDTTLRPDLRRFAEARESLVHLYGLQAYVDIMCVFAVGDRYIFRVWSLLADGYVDEATTFLSRALSQFEDAQRLSLAANSQIA